ncbi:SDR family NAD(P)-dependent oxidoreductase [Hymenobacter sp. H14-R3]|uniref:SDR family NAD(P)-dependent oxidoreductase n=1 Tax=Hymenobacter sp. H14-R3 TaxID=3046308 RepID=UPI0024B9705A|nr:SDR family NAD(P)-dependent oxidoreductase [Hymenobacter sp. H14-R3]MDJ0367108.1 SDR family NAD(P)-dependent oxidoreductase [Hymenobacter sp. H14-R3]
MKPPTVLITGGTSGIGKATATHFAHAGYPVVITARDAARGRATAAQISARTSNPQVRYLVGELGTIKGCQALVALILEEVPDLQLLINNAGVFMTKRVLNADGLETNFMVNYLAPFILSTGLVELLARNAPSRILTVNTGLHLQGHFDLARTPCGLDFSGRASYCNTKLANALFTVEQAGRVRHRGITVNAMSPGLYNTRVLKVTGWLRVAVRVGGAGLGLVQPLARSGKAPFYLATAPELAAVTGAYFDQQKLAAFAPQAADAQLRKELWDRTLGWI